MKTCPCNEEPHTSHFYIVKLGFTGAFIFFLFALKYRSLVPVGTASVRRFEQKYDVVIQLHVPKTAEVDTLVVGFETRLKTATCNACTRSRELLQQTSKLTFFSGEVLWRSMVVQFF